MKKVILLWISIFLFNTQSISQEWLTVPDFFTSQCKQSDLDKINSGEKDLNEYLKNSQNDRIWQVYADRDGCRLKNMYNGSNNGKQLEFLEPLLVTEVRENNWLHVYNAYTKEEKGWIQSKYLILSKYSLKTEGDIDRGEISIPRKAIVLHSLNSLTDSPEQSFYQYYYFDGPSPSNGKKIGTAKTFNILFPLKEQDGSVLLSTTDVLMGSDLENKKKIKGWMPKANITSWNSRIALEPSRSPDAIEEYYGKKLYVYRNIDELELCLKENWCLEDKSITEFEVGKILSKQFRFPLINSIDANIKEICVVYDERYDSLSRHGSILGPGGGCTDFYDALISYSSLKGFVALDYYGNGINALEPVVFLTHQELTVLKSKLKKMLYYDCQGNSERKKCFQENIFNIVKSILGYKTSTSSIENLTMNQTWNILFGVNFGDKTLRDRQLNDLSSLSNRKFKAFYEKFAKSSTEFLKNSYVHKDLYLNRRFSFEGDYYYWIPLEDLPGCKFVE